MGEPDFCRHCGHRLVWDERLNRYCSTGRHHAFGRTCERGPGTGHSPFDPSDLDSVGRFLDG